MYYSHASVRITDIYYIYVAKAGEEEKLLSKLANKLTTSGHKANHFVTKMTSTGQT
jgi:hypothetical protein